MTTTTLQLRTRWLSRTLVGLLLAFAALDLLTGSARQWLGRPTSLYSLVSLTAGQGFPRWMASILWISAAGCALLLRRSGGTPRPLPGRQWSIAALLCVALSVEESAQLLDRMIGPLHSAVRGFAYAPWMLFVAALVVLILLRPLVMTLPGRGGRALVAAIVLYATGRSLSVILVSAYPTLLGSQATTFALAAVVGRLAALAAAVLTLVTLVGELRRQNVALVLSDAGVRSAAPTERV